MSNEIDKGHVSDERARELVASSPLIHPVQSGYSAEPPIQFNEDLEEQYSEVYTSAKPTGMVAAGGKLGPSPNGPRYQVHSRVAAAPKSHGGQYRRPVHIRVCDTHHSNYQGRGSHGAVKEWNNVDSRYGGHKSAHGKALMEAHSLAAELNHKHESGS